MYDLTSFHLALLSRLRHETTVVEGKDSSQEHRSHSKTKASCKREREKIASLVTTTMLMLLAGFRGLRHAGRIRNNMKIGESHGDAQSLANYPGSHDLQKSANRSPEACRTGHADPFGFRVTLYWYTTCFER